MKQLLVKLNLLACHNGEFGIDELLKNIKNQNKNQQDTFA